MQVGFLPTTKTTGRVTAGPQFAIGSCGDASDASDELLRALAESRKAWWKLVWPLLASLATICWIIHFQLGWRWWNIAAWPLLFFWLASYRAYRDATVELTYELADEWEGSFQQLQTAVMSLRGSQLLESAGEVYDSKYHAGASGIVSTSRNVAVYEYRFANTRVNVTPIALRIGRICYVIMPDRVIRVDNGKMSNLSYSELMTAVDSRVIIENQVPDGAKVVSTTWQYTNKDGGPDKRFAVNPQRFSILYHTLRVQSAAGLDRTLLNVRAQSIEAVAAALKAMQAVGGLSEDCVPSPPKPKASEVYFEESGIRFARWQLVSVYVAGILASFIPPIGVPIFVGGVVFQCMFSYGIFSDPESEAYRGALNALGCMMVADKVVAQEEKFQIVKILTERFELKPKRVKRDLNSFVNAVEQEGPHAAVGYTSAKLRHLDDHDKKLVLRCLKLVAMADGKVCRAEKAMFARLRKSLKDRE
ncbi:MAG: TerB family tellurite resistance protein [Planctomycetaceae bacterium]|nr:TerB family tellurite resistance protein [Planctomycetaceae bacterium]